MLDLRFNDTGRAFALHFRGRSRKQQFRPASLFLGARFTCQRGKFTYQSVKLCWRHLFDTVYRLLQAARDHAAASPGPIVPPSLARR
jgi:hypothetical protein